MERTKQCKRSIRFTDVDEFIEPVPDIDDEVSTVASSTEPGMPSLPAHHEVPQVKEITEPEHEHAVTEEAVVHALLGLESTIFWDMARSPSDINHPSLDTEPPAAWKADMKPLSTLSIRVEGMYKWKISVTNAERGYPTLRDTLVAIWENTSKIASKIDAEDVPNHTRNAVFMAHARRCRDLALVPHTEPLRRVDFMMQSRRFLGLSPVPGTFELEMNIGVLPT